jgi:hypothetical protein
MSELEQAAQRRFYEQVHRLSPVETWANLPEAAKEVFRQKAQDSITEHP